MTTSNHAEALERLLPTVDRTEALRLLGSISLEYAYSAGGHEHRVRSMEVTEAVVRQHTEDGGVTLVLDLRSISQPGEVAEGWFSLAHKPVFQSTCIGDTGQPAVLPFNPLKSAPLADVVDYYDGRFGSKGFLTVVQAVGAHYLRQGQELTFPLLSEGAKSDIGITAAGLGLDAPAFEAMCRACSFASALSHDELVELNIEGRVVQEPLDVVELLASGRNVALNLSRSSDEYIVQLLLASVAAQWAGLRSCGERVPRLFIVLIGCNLRRSQRFQEHTFPALLNAGISVHSLPGHLSSPQVQAWQIAQGTVIASFPDFDNPTDLELRSRAGTRVFTA